MMGVEDIVRLAIFADIHANRQAFSACLDSARARGAERIVCLGDMPQVRAPLIDKLIAAFDPERGALVVIPTLDGKRGNPVVWSRRFFHDLMAIEGDVGARVLISRYPEAVTEVPVTDTAALTDVDTPDAFEQVKAEIERA